MKAQPPPKHLTSAHMEVPKSTEPMHIELYDELFKLVPMLQRNLGRIVEIKNVSKLIQSIEGGTVLAVADASLGARDCAAHAYIISTSTLDAFIEGEAPVDCDPDDLESTRSETDDMIATQTIINFLMRKN